MPFVQVLNMMVPCVTPAVSNPSLVSAGSAPSAPTMTSAPHVTMEISTTWDTGSTESPHQAVRGMVNRPLLSYKGFVWQCHARRNSLLSVCPCRGQDMSLTQHADWVHVLSPLAVVARRQAFPPLSAVQQGALAEKNADLLLWYLAEY